MKHRSSIQRNTAALVRVTVSACQVAAASHDGPGDSGAIDDALITGEIQVAVRKEPRLKSAAITVETRQGRVLLSGFVASSADRDRAAALARDVRGVSAVRNNLQLRQGSRHRQEF